MDPDPAKLSGSGWIRIQNTIIITDYLLPPLVDMLNQSSLMLLGTIKDHRFTDPELIGFIQYNTQYIKPYLVAINLEYWTINILLQVVLSKMSG